MSLKKFSIVQKNSEISNFDLKYMAIGLAGEMGEILNEIKKLERDDNNLLNNNRRNKIITEMGDMMWYFEGICRRLNCTIEEVIENNIQKITSN